MSSYGLRLLHRAQTKGMRVVEDPNLVYHKTIKRTWRERLRSRPWAATRVIEVPDPTVYESDLFNAIYGHPATIQSLRLALNAQQEKP